MNISNVKSKTMANIHFSSKTDAWETPLELFTKLDAEFGFTVDVCANPDNAKCSNYFTPQIDGLKQDWHGVCWMNPPYGKQIKKWVQKAYISSLFGSTIVCLIPARTDTYWWHTYVRRANEVRFIRGRLKFGGSKNSAPFPSAIAIFRLRVGVPEQDRTNGLDQLHIATILSGERNHHEDL